MSQVTNILTRSPALGDVINKPRSLWHRWHIDPVLVGLFLLFCPFSLAVLYSASGFDMGYVYSQLRNFAAALAAMFIFAQFNLYAWRRLALLVYLIGLLLLLLVPWFGITVNGAQRWLDLGLIKFQPSELMKLALPVLCAWALSQGEIPPRLLKVGMCLLIIGLPAFLIVRQPDLGTALLVAAAGVATLFLSGVSWWYFVAGLLLAVLMAPAIWIYALQSYQKDRILTLLYPDRDPLGSGWNILQSKIAIGSGGLDGKGWQAGTQSHLSFLPEGHTDFIFSVLAEEFGFYGVLLLLTLYALLLARALWLNVRSQHIFGRLLGGSLISTLFVYVFVNITMVSGLIPVVGVPLPFISYGGTSLVTLAASLGMVMALRFK